MTVEEDSLPTRREPVMRKVHALHLGGNPTPSEEGSRSPSRREAVMDSMGSRVGGGRGLVLGGGARRRAGTRSRRLLLVGMDGPMTSIGTCEDWSAELRLLIS